MNLFGAHLINKILTGTDTRSAVFESISLFRNNADYEAINSENELMFFNGTIAAFSPYFELVSETPQYKEYSFQVYCPDLIGSVYDADDPHPIEVTCYLPVNFNPDETHFPEALKSSFDSGVEIRDAIKFLYAPGESVFKQMKIKHL